MWAAMGKIGGAGNRIFPLYNKHLGKNSLQIKG